MSGGTEKWSILYSTVNSAHLCFSRIKLGQWLMPEKTNLDEFRRRANEVRGIAQTLYDKAERAIVLMFVDDCEKQIAKEARPQAGQLSPN